MSSAGAESVILPFSEADFVGPEDRPRGAWEITMFEWQAFGNSTIKEWLDEMAGASIRAIQCAPKPEEGLIYVVACDPTAPKAHHVSISPNHRSATFSLYTPLLAFDFPKVGDKYKAIFTCWPETYGKTKVLTIQVKGYRTEKVDKNTQQAVAALRSAQGQIAAGSDQAAPESE